MTDPSVAEVKKLDEKVTDRQLSTEARYFDKKIDLAVTPTAP